MKLEGFIGPTYALAHKSAGSQRLVNLYPEVHEAGPRKGNVARFVGTPGLRKLATLGDGPTRGHHYTATGQLFVVSGANVYEVFSDWSYALRPGALASSSGRVTMADGVADDAAVLVIGDGGPTAFSMELAAGEPVEAIADEDCPGGHVAWQDGYLIHTVPGTGRFQISGLNSLDYDSADVSTSEGRPDNVVMVLSVGRMLWLFGTQTTEVFWNSGNADFPFERNQAAFIENGTASAGSCVRAGGSVAWVGSDERGEGTVWHARGFQPARISTHAIERALSKCANLAQCSAFAYQQEGHEFYVLSVPASDTDGGGTWVYDFSTGNWHERMYLGDSGEEPHRAHVGAVAFGEVVVGDREDGRIYALDLEHYTDDGDEIRRVRQTPHISQGEKRIRHNSFELQCEVGPRVQLPGGPPEFSPFEYVRGFNPELGYVFAVTGSGDSPFVPGGTILGLSGESAVITSVLGGGWLLVFAGLDAADFPTSGTLRYTTDQETEREPVAMLSWSDDGGHTWSNEHAASLGAQGKYKTRVIWRRLGVSRDRVYRVAVSDPVPVAWLGAELDAVQLDR